jgi:hypothetical protein
MKSGWARRGFYFAPGEAIKCLNLYIPAVPVLWSFVSVRAEFTFCFLLTFYLWVRDSDHEDLIVIALLDR